MVHDASYKVILKKNKVKADGRCPIYIRVTKHRKPSYFSLGENCIPDQFDEIEQRLWIYKPRINDKDKKELSTDKLKVKKASYAKIQINPKAKVINAKIDDSLYALKAAEKSLRDSQQPVSLKGIRKLVVKPADLNNSFLQFYYRMMENNIKIELAYNTYRGYRSTYNKLLEYQKGKDLSFDDVTEEFLEEFKLKMRKDGYKSETIKKHFKWMGSIWKRAKKKILGNPFADVQIAPDEKIYKDRLSMLEIKLLQKAGLEGRLSDVRNMFLFSFFHAGIRIGDILTLKWLNVKDNYLSYRMRKNKKLVQMKVNPIGKRILNKYQKIEHDPHDYIFGLIENGISETGEYMEKQIQSKTAIVNHNLKKVATFLNINKNLTFHISRHSFTFQAVDKNINAFDTSYLLRHSKVQTTEDYIGGENAARSEKALKTIFKGYR